MSTKVALITGAAQGLGEAIARELHAGGLRVAVADINVSGATKVAGSLDPSGQSALAIALDVREKSAFESARDRLVDVWGQIDVVVNNAALTRTTPVMQIGAGEFDEVMSVNLRGTFFGCQVFGEYLRQRGAGRIINIASQAGQVGGTVTGAHYAASKAGIIVLTKIFAKELAGAGVTVNSVAPGPIDLPQTRASLPSEHLAAIGRAIPVGRMGDPAEVAAVVAWLASDRASFVTGATWDVNGGLLMR